MKPPDVGFSLSEPTLRAAPETLQEPLNFSLPKSCLYPYPDVIFLGRASNPISLCL